MRCDAGFVCRHMGFDLSHAIWRSTALIVVRIRHVVGKARTKLIRETWNGALLVKEGTYVATATVQTAVNFTSCNKLDKKKRKHIPFIFNDESTGSCVCLRLDLYVSYVKDNMLHSG
jgi:hypothetical protein